MIGVAFDGTGYGTDGTIWGGEFLIATLAGFHARRPPRPGPAARRRRRDPPAVAHGRRLPRRGGPGRRRASPVARRNADRWGTVTAMARRRVNAPLTSSAGRLFDAVAAILGVRDEITYEGQAAIELEQLADPGRPARTGRASRRRPSRRASRSARAARTWSPRPSRTSRRRAAERHRGPFPQRPGRPDRRRLRVAARATRPGHGGPLRRGLPEPAAPRAHGHPAWRREASPC